jgi:membrane associated rhomboid family serine protease
MTNFRAGGFQQLPMVVKNLIIINVLVFAFTYLAGLKGINLDDYLALHYWQSPLFRWWQLFTHMFMHGSIAHIFFNMFALWMFGRILENVWGPQRFLLFYLICGLGAAFCHLGVLTFEYTGYHNDFMAYQQHPSLNEFLAFIKKNNVPVDPSSMSGWMADPNSIDQIRGSITFLYRNYAEMINEATLGASGAVFGLLFAFGYLFPNTELYIFFIPIPIKAKWVVGGYALLELSQGLYNSAGDNIAHFAHLGGMLFAFILLRIWKNKIRNDFY